MNFLASTTAYATEVSYSTFYFEPSRFSDILLIVMSVVNIAFALLLFVALIFFIRYAHVYLKLKAGDTNNRTEKTEDTDN